MDSNTATKFYQDRQCRIFWQIVGKFVEAHLADNTLPYKDPFPYFGFSFFVSTHIGVDINLNEFSTLDDVPAVQLILPGVIKLGLDTGWNTLVEEWKSERLTGASQEIIDGSLLGDEQDDGRTWTTDEVLALVDRIIKFCIDCHSKSKKT